MKKVISLLGIMAGVILAVAIGAGSVRAEAHDNHCICGGNGTCIAVAAANGHTANTPTAWQEATDDTTFRDLITNTADGGEVFIYLGASFEMSDSHVSVTGKTIHLCLNGCTITTKSTRRLFYLNLNDTLTICDCSEGEAGKITAPDGATGVDGVGGLIRCVGSTVELYSGTLANGFAKGSNNGGIISCVKSTSAGSSTFKMYGGTITGGKAGGRAGNVDISESYFYMYGGTISGGKPTKWGGNVSLASSSTFVMEGGTISGGNAGSYGGNVVINASSASFTMNGGEITGGTSTTSGGNVYNAGTFTMNGGEITGGTSGSHGGNIATEKPMTMNGGEISGGTATTYGGNLSVTTNGTATLKGGEISGGTAGSYDGWNIFSEGTLTINGNPVITNTPPSGSYYDVYIKKTCTISGEPVFKIDTTSTARGIKLNTTNATLTVNGGYFLCNVYATGGAQATLKGGVYSKNVVSETKDSSTANITVDGGFYYGDVKPTDSNPGTMEINGGCFRKSPIEDANITYNANLWTTGGDFRIPFTGYAKYKETDGSAHYLQMQYALTTCEQITGKNMTLNENLALGLYVNVDLDHPLYKNRDNVGKISVTLNGETREAALTTLADYDATTKKFSFEGVTPELMGDTITVELIASDGVSVIDTKTYTIKGYLEELLTTGTPSTELTNLVHDLLIYGGEAQKKFDHNADNLVSAGITGTSGDPSGDVTVIYNKNEVTAANYQDASVIPGYFKEATAIHENINWIRVKYQDNVDDGNTTFTIQKGTGAEEAATLDHGYLCTGGLKPTEYGTTIIFRAYRGTEEISRVEYSMNSYCVRKHSATGHEFSDALYRYGASAAAYAAAN